MSESRPQKPGLYAARGGNCQWPNLVVSVEGTAPYLHCRWWDLMNDTTGKGTFPLSAVILYELVPGDDMSEVG